MWARNPHAQGGWKQNTWSLWPNNLDSSLKGQRSGESKCKHDLCTSICSSTQHVCPSASEFLKCDTSMYWNGYDQRSTDTCSNMEKSWDMTPSEKPPQKTISCILVMRCPKQEVHRDRKTRAREVAVVTLCEVLSLVNWQNCSKTGFGIGCPICEKNPRNHSATHVTCVSTRHKYSIKLHLFEFKANTVCVASSRSARAT